MDDNGRAILAELVRRGITLDGERRPETFREYVTRVRPSFRWYKHCEVIAGVLQRVADGELKRVMIFAPPRLGKSELASRLLPAYFLNRYPARWVGLASFGADLAHDLSRSARDYYSVGGGASREDVQSVRLWKTTTGGGMWAAGIGGRITGMGWHLGIIDDPLKDDEAASSELILARQREWFDSTWSSREEDDIETGDPNGAMVVMLTRWSPEDIVGWLLEQEEEAEDEGARQRWHIVSLEALKEEEPEHFPASCTVEPDWRSPGESICPERRPAEKFERVKARISPYWWNAIYQQRPRPREGAMFPVENLKWCDACPNGLTYVRFWDKAATENAGCFTAGVLMGRSPQGLYYVKNVRMGQWSAMRREGIIRDTAEEDGHAVHIYHEREPGSGGKDSAENTTRNLAGYTVFEDLVTGSKEERAQPLAAQVEAGNVYVERDTEGDRWNKAFKDQLRDFPRGKFKDVVDAAAGAFNKLAAKRSSGRCVYGPRRISVGLRIR